MNLGFLLAHPEALWGLLLVLPVVLFHMYHRRRVEVAYLPLLSEAAGPRRVGAGWRRLREATSLLLRLLALVALVLALAGIRPSQAATPPEALVLVVDGDVTTRTREADGRTRRAHLADLAEAWARSRTWRWVAVLEAGPLPLTRLRRTGPAQLPERGTLLGGETAAGRGDLDGALAQARALASKDGPARVVVLTARALDVPEDQVPAIVEGAGAASDNQGIAAFEIHGEPDGLHRRLEVRVFNEAEEAKTRDLLVSLGGELHERHSLELPARGEASVALTLLPPPGGAMLTLRLDGDDPFATDDAVHAYLAPPLRPSVLIVHDAGGRPYTRAALEAMGDQIDAEGSGSVRAEDLARAALRDVNVVDGQALPAGALRPGAWLFLAPLGGALPFEVLEVIERPLVWRSAPDHPLLLDVDLESAYVARAFPVSGPDVRALAEADAQAVLAEGETDAGVSFVALGLDPQGSDLPVRAAYPLLVRNAIRRLARAPADPFPSYLVPGDVLRARGRRTGRVTLTWPGGTARASLRPEEEGFRVPPGARGPVEIRSETGPVGWTAFVDLDPARRITPARAEATPRVVAPPPPDRPGRWRRTLLLLAAALLLADLLVFTLSRRPAGKLAATRTGG